MLKPVLLLLLFLFCSSYGILKNISVKYRLLNLKNAKNLVFTVRNEIDFSGKDIYDIAEKLSVSDNLGFMQYMSNRCFSPSENYDYAKSCIGKGLFFEKSDWVILDDFFSSLGLTSFENQLLLCDKNIKLLEKQSNEAEENYKKYSKLYTSSGILVGLFLVIILV